MINVCVSFRNTVSAARALGRASGCSRLLWGRARLAHFELTVKKKDSSRRFFGDPIARVGTGKTGSPGPLIASLIDDR